jgi:hypothetical protein
LDPKDIACYYRGAVATALLMLVLLLYCYQLLLRCRFAVLSGQTTP